MLTKEQANAAADALTQQQASSPAPAAPRNPFLLPALVLFAGVVSGVVGYLTESRAVLLSTLAFVVVMIVLMTRSKRRND